MFNFPAWFEINLDNLKYNYHQIQKKIGINTPVLAVVKADGYGHGAVEVSKVLVKSGAKYLGVATIDEALQLKKAGIESPVLILLAGVPSQAELIVKNNLTQTVGSLFMARALSKAGKKLHKTAKIHIKIDTGIGRIGFFPEEALEAVKKIKKLPNLEIEGIYSHFATTPLEDKSYTLLQWKKFKEVLDKLEKNNIKIKYRHIANSAVITEYPQMKLDLVRPGIMLYGLYPNTNSYYKKMKIKPVLSLKAKVIAVRKYNKSHNISYGRTYTAKPGDVIATIPVGYADGINRNLSNKGEVLIKGKKAPIVGRVCMDQIMVDVTGLKDIKTGETAVIIGKQGKNEISINDYAKMLNTISYEVVTLMSIRLPKIYWENGKIVKIKTIYS